MATQLARQRFPAGSTGFFRAPVLLSGGKEALLIDGGFTLSDGETRVNTVTTMNV